MNHISFIGLGKLGLPLATSLAKNGVTIHGIDTNDQVIRDLNASRAPFYEPGLQDNIMAAAPHIRYTTKYDGIDDTDGTLILVNTPSNKTDGSFSNLYIEKALETICTEIRNKKSYHLFIISSTVMPGSIHNSFIPLIESLTGWTLDQQFGITYIPDFVALGKVIHDFENPNYLIIGASNAKARKLAESLYRKIITNDPPVCHLSIEEAEIAKISLNAYVTMKISFANFLARVCERTPNTNVDKITEAIGNDPRISPHFFRGGLAFGGTCFPRDTWAFIKMAENLGMQAHHIQAAETINQEQNEHLIQKTISTLFKHNHDAISILGLSFKPGTSVINESPAIHLIHKLLISKFKIHVYDSVPETLRHVRSLFKDQIIYHDSATSCIQATHYTVLALVEKAYLDALAVLPNDIIVLDPWRALPQDHRVKQLGIGH